MPPEIVPLLQLASLVAVGLLLRSRVMVVLVAAVMVAWVVLGTHRSDLALSTPEQLAMAFGGIAVGLLAALWAVASRRERVDARRWAHEIEASSPRLRGAAAPAGRTSGATWTFALLLIAVAAGGGLYVEGDTVPQWRRTVDGWLASPTLQALGLPSLHGGKTTPAGHVAQASAPAAKGTGDKPRARQAATGERPQGDIRHCLEQGVMSDVLRCAERGR